MTVPRRVLPVIVIAQFLCTSLWFAGNAVMGGLRQDFGLPAEAVGSLTSAVQFGFISGTLVFALLSVADRFSPSKVFCYCAALGALFNLGVTWEGNTYGSLLAFRFATGFFLAGIYPVGMKIAADYFDRGLGRSLGYLVGALVLGTALPHLLRDVIGSLPWQWVLYLTSGLAVIGGLLMVVLIPDGPYRRAGAKLEPRAAFTIFRDREFRAAAGGYFGHMWELYTFWAFVPLLLTTYAALHPATVLNIPLLSFAIIAAGGPGCVLAGYLAEGWGTRRIAATALALSGICSLLLPLTINYFSPVLFVTFLIFWGMVVVADSPLFSTLVAQRAPVATRGTALTMVNCIGFAITIVSIQLIGGAVTLAGGVIVYALLAIGPIMGLLALRLRTD